MINKIESYILKNFLSVFILTLLGSTLLFVVFDFFERLRVFLKEKAEIIDAVSYLLLKIPMIIHLMTPIAVLIGTLISIGRLSQLSEITAMRACGVSIYRLAKPILIVATFLTLINFILGESLVPWATKKVDQIYQLDIKKKLEKGAYSKADFWHRSENKLIKVALYDSKNSELRGINIYELDNNFDFIRRIDSNLAKWEGERIGWVLNGVVESSALVNESQNIASDRSFIINKFDALPLQINEKPEDFYNIKRESKTMTYLELKEYIKKLKVEGVSTVKYQVELLSKISLPFVNIIVVLLAFPFGVISSRTGNLTKRFLIGASLGLGFHLLHGLATSLGAAELLPPLVSAWTANIFLGLLGLFLMARADFS